MRCTPAFLLAIALLASPASAATYTFTFDGSIDSPGTVSGLIEGLMDDGLGQSASSVTVTSVVGSAFDFSSIYGLNFAAPTPPDQIGSRESIQRFDVVGGVIAFGQFAAQDQVIDFDDFKNGSVRLLCFYSTGIDCPGLLWVDDINGLAQIFRPETDGPGVRFTRLPDEPSPVPLPAGAGLLVAALALMGLVSRPGLFARRSKLA